MASRNYTDLIAWQKAMVVAEAEFGNQLSVAHGSIRELETHVMLAGRLRFLSADVVEGILRQTGEVGRLVTGLSKSLMR